MITLLFRCGHRQQVDVDKVTSPACLECGERQVARTIGVGAPRFTGVASGPSVTTKALPAIAVTLAEKPMPLTVPAAEGVN